MASTDLEPRRVLLDGLIDYAGLFPPARLRMADAVLDYQAAKVGPFAWMLERFICPATRMPELEGALAEFVGSESNLEAGQRVGIALVVDSLHLGEEERISAELSEILAPHKGVRVELLEVRLTGGGDGSGPLSSPVVANRIKGLADAIRASGWSGRAFIEIPLNSAVESTLEALAKHGIGAKVRCGGVSIDSAPTPKILAQFISSCTHGEIPWKATAGLHHPFRHLASSGQYEHGFVNLLVASGLAEASISEEVIQAALSDEDPSHFTFDTEGLHWGEHDLKSTGRKFFVGYGSCSFEEPTTELIALGVPLAAIGSDSGFVVS